MQGPEPEHPVTPTEPTCNDGAGHDDLDAEDPVDQLDDDEDLAPKDKRACHVLKYEVVKRWVTGDRSEKDDDDN